MFSFMTIVYITKSQIKYFVNKQDNDYVSGPGEILDP